MWHHYIFPFLNDSRLHSPLPTSRATETKIYLVRPHKSSDLGTLLVHGKQKFKPSIKRVFHPPGAVTSQLRSAGQALVGLMSPEDHFFSSSNEIHDLGSDTNLLAHVRIWRAACLPSSKLLITFNLGFAASQNSIVKKNMLSRCVYPEHHSTERLWQLRYRCDT